MYKPMFRGSKSPFLLLKLLWNCLMEVCAALPLLTPAWWVLHGGERGHREQTFP